MFDEIVVRRSQSGGSGGPVNLGELAETILFYGQVDVIFTRAAIGQLLGSCGPMTLIRLVEDGYVRAFNGPNLAVRTEQAGTPAAVHSFAFFRVGDGGAQGETRDLWYQMLGRSGKTRRLADRFGRHVEPYLYPEALRPMAQQAVSDPLFALPAVRAILRAQAPGYAVTPDMFFEAEQIEDMKFRINTSLDLDAVERAHVAAGGAPGELTEAHLLGEIYETAADLLAAASFSADLATSTIGSELLALPWTTNQVPASVPQADLQRFTDLTLQGRSVAESINAGERSLEEFLPVLDESRRFRDWLRQQPPDADFVREYQAEIEARTWISSLPAKGLRWLITGVAGVASPVAGAIVGAADTFIVERLVRGWRPDQFVNRHLRRFTEPAE